MYTNKDCYQNPENKALLETINKAVKGIKVWRGVTRKIQMTQKGHSGFFEQQSKPSTQGAFCDEIKKEVYNIYYYGPKSTKAAGLEGGGEKERNQILQFINKDKERHKSNIL